MQGRVALRRVSERRKGQRGAKERRSEIKRGKKNPPGATLPIDTYRLFSSTCALSFAVLRLALLNIRPYVLSFYPSAHHRMSALFNDDEHRRPSLRFNNGWHTAPLNLIFRGLIVAESRLEGTRTTAILDSIEDGTLFLLSGIIVNISYRGH